MSPQKRLLLPKQSRVSPCWTSCRKGGLPLVWARKETGQPSRWVSAYTSTISQQTKGWDFGNTCRRVNSFSPFPPIPFLYKVKDVCLVRTAYLCYWGRQWICSPGLLVWFEKYDTAFLEYLEAAKRWKLIQKENSWWLTGCSASAFINSKVSSFETCSTNIHLNSGLLPHFSFSLPSQSCSTLKGMKHFHLIIWLAIKIVLTGIFKNEELTECLWH